MERPVVLQASGLSRAFGHRKVISDVSLEIRQGEFVLLVGRNGAGKSTLLRLFGGLLRPDRGRVTVSGYLPNELHQNAETPLALLAQESFLYGELTIRENLELVRCCLAFRRRRRKDREQGLSGVDEVIAMFELDTFADRKAKEASQGILQRASLARLFFERPAMMLLDEPFSHLDRDSAACLKRLLLDYQKQGTAICSVIHEGERFVEISPRVYELVDGALRPQ